MAANRHGVVVGERAKREGRSGGVSDFVTWTVVQAEGGAQLPTGYGLGRESLVTSLGEMPFDKTLR